jgi:Predicted transcriptional regulators
MADTYKIGEAANLLNLKAYVLRFWETEFPDVIPLRTAKGQRLYTGATLALLERIRYLLHDQGLTISGARRILAEEKERGIVYSFPADGSGQNIPPDASPPFSPHDKSREKNTQKHAQYNLPGISHDAFSDSVRMGNLMPGDAEGYDGRGPVLQPPLPGPGRQRNLSLFGPAATSDIQGQDQGEYIEGHPPVLAAENESLRQALNARESAMNTRETSLDTREASLEARINSLNSKENALNARESTLDAKGNAMNAREISLDAKEASLEARENSLNGKETSLNARENALDTQRTHTASSRANIRDIIGELQNITAILRG